MIVLFPQCRLRPLQFAHFLIGPLQLLLQTLIELDGLPQLSVTWGANQLQLPQKCVPDVLWPHRSPRPACSSTTALSFNSVRWDQFSLNEGDGSCGRWNSGGTAGGRREGAAPRPLEGHLQGEAASIAPLQRRAEVLHQLPQSGHLIWRGGEESVVILHSWILHKHMMSLNYNAIDMRKKLQTAERCSQWLWIRRKDPNWAPRC